MKNRTWITTLSAALLVSFGVATYLVGQEKETDKKPVPVNDKCPLSGKAIDAAATSDVKVSFCCNNCKGKFDKEPTKFLSKVDKVPNEKCPLSGKELGDASGSVTVAFCCEKCKAKFDKEPAKFLKDVKAKEKKKDQ